MRIMKQLISNVFHFFRSFQRTVKGGDSIGAMKSSVISPSTNLYILAAQRKPSQWHSKSPYTRTGITTSLENSFISSVMENVHSLEWAHFIIWLFAISGYFLKKGKCQCVFVEENFIDNHNGEHLTYRLASRYFTWEDPPFSRGNKHLKITLSVHECNELDTFLTFLEKCCIMFLSMNQICQSTM